MAVGADDVALVDFGLKARRRGEHRCSSGEAERLAARLAVIEVHLVSLEDAAAVETRNRSRLPQVVVRSVLSDPDAL
jgi:hypothetical protein